MLSCFLSFGIILKINSISFISYVVQFDHYVYLEVVLIALAFCLAVFNFRQNSQLEQICFYTKAEIVLGKMLGTLGCSLSLCLIPIVFVIVHSLGEQTQASYNIAAILYVSIRWCSIILASQSIAFFCGFVINSLVSYILCLPTAIIFSYLNHTIIDKLFGHGHNTDKISAFFSMQKTYVTGIAVDYTGARVDLFLLTKFICVLAFVMIILTLIWILNGNKRKLPAVLLTILLAIEVGSVYAWSMLYPIKYAYEDKIWVTPTDPQVCTVMSYTGDFTLSEFSRFDCAVKISPARQQIVTFRLDSCLEIKEITYNDKPLPYTRDGDYVTVNLLQEYKTPITLLFHYSGRIYYVSDVDEVNIFATTNSAALPGKFAFIPIIDSDCTSKHYKINVKTHNKLISNLDVEEIGKWSYVLSGDARTCCLFSGYFSEYEQNGIQFYRAMYNQYTDYTAVYEDSFNYPSFNAFTFKYDEELRPEPKKVFLIYSLYGVAGFPIVYDDYILINYGYGSSD